MAKNICTSFRFNEETTRQLTELSEKDKRSKASVVEILIAQEYERLAGGVNVQYQDNTPNQSAPETHPEKP